MNANVLSVPSSKGSNNVRAVLLAGIVAASFDLAFAFSFHGIMSGASPVRILKVIATGWLGTDALNGGAAVAALGFVSHYGILIGAAAIYCMVLSRSHWMRANALLCGVLYGLCIYAFMHLVVLPLSNAPAFKPTVIGTSADFAMHVLVIGPAITLMLRRFARFS